MKVRITLIEEMLGTACPNKEVHEEFIASKSADAEKMKEELEALPAEELMNKAITIYPRDTDGIPFIYDFQIKGFFKEAFGSILDFGETLIVGKAKLSRWISDRMVDRHIHVYPHRIRLAPVGEICTRPLRAKTQKGERVSLLSSETVPAGTAFEMDIETDHPVLDEMVARALNRGAENGLGQWQNSGKGRFTWEEV